MILKFKGGVWDGLQIEAAVAPQFINLQGTMHKSRREVPELVETLLLADFNGTKYLISEHEEGDDADIIQYRPAE